MPDPVYRNIRGARNPDHQRNIIVGLRAERDALRSELTIARIELAGLTAAFECRPCRHELAAIAVLDAFNDVCVAPDLREPLDALQAALKWQPSVLSDAKENTP
jgi:hypothetical protein